MQKRHFSKNSFYCALAWGLCLLLLALLFVFRQSTVPYCAAAEYMRNTASQEPIAFPSEHLLYGGSGYTSGTFIYSNSNHEQLVYLSGDGYYHKSNICTVCDRETSALIYYGALAYLPELSPCRICSSEDIR